VNYPFLKTNFTTFYHTVLLAAIDFNGGEYEEQAITRVTINDIQKYVAICIRQLRFQEIFEEQHWISK